MRSVKAEIKGRMTKGSFSNRSLGGYISPLRGLEKMLGNIEWTAAEGRKTREVRELLKELEAE